MSEEKKLETEKNAIDEKKMKIKELTEKLNEQRRKLENRKEDLKRHQQYNDFLEKVVGDKNGENKEFQDIEELQNRFKNLKNENEKLVKKVKHFSALTCVRVQKDQINDQMTEERKLEAAKMMELQQRLHEMNGRMQGLQSELEKVIFFGLYINRFLIKIQRWNKILKTKSTKRTRIARKSAKL